MTKDEEQTIRNIIARLERDNLGAAGVDLNCPSRIEGDTTQGGRLYVETWVISPLRFLLPESRDTKLARSMSQ